jgi:hypothetical protein
LWFHCSAITGSKEHAGKEFGNAQQAKRMRWAFDFRRNTRIPSQVCIDSETDEPESLAKSEEEFQAAMLNSRARGPSAWWMDDTKHLSRVFQQGTESWKQPHLTKDDR